MRTFAKFHLLLMTLAGSCLIMSQAAHAGLDQWMKDLSEEAPAALDQKLSEFVFPGTHDSGTYDLMPKKSCKACKGSSNITDKAEGPEEECLAFIDDLDFLDIGFPSDDLCYDIEEFISTIVMPFAKAQEKSLLTQLNEGARFFDLRFFRAEQEDADRLPQNGAVITGEFYIHHTVIGPSSQEILSDFTEFLNMPGHAKEVIIIKLFNMQEGNKSRMSDESLQVFYQQMFDAFGAYIAPNDVITGKSTVNDMLDAGYQVIVIDKEPALALDECPSVETPCFTKNLIWTSSDSTSFSGASGYPEAQDWDKESELFSMLKGLGENREDPEKLWSMNVSLGSDDNGTMTYRCFICPYDAANVSGFCPAINDDWDELCSLEDASEYTNPKTISALVGLPRQHVNSFLADFYTPAFTREAYKLNLGAARVVYKIKTVKTLSSTGLESKQDFYPEISFSGSGGDWGDWGGPHLEKIDDNSISPNWTARRSALASAPLETVQAAIYDEDGAELGEDDLFDVEWINADGFYYGGRHTLFIPVEECLDQTLYFSGCAVSGSSAGKTSDSAKITYSYQVCKWGACPGDALVITTDAEIESLSIDRHIVIEPGVTYTIKGDVTIEPSGSIVNHGTLIIDGLLTSDGTIENKKTDDYTGIIIVNGDLWVREKLTNGGTIANYGVVRGTDTDGYIINEAGGVIDDQYGDYAFVRVHNDGKVYANMDDWFFAGGGFKKISGANPIDYTTEYIGAPSEKYNCQVAFNGIWTEATSTCLVEGYWFQEGRQVHVFEGITLKISGSAFVNEGTIVNDGVIDNSNGKFVNCDAGAALGNQPLAAVETCVESEQSVLCESEPFNGTYDQLAETPTCLVGGLTLTEELRIQPGMDWRVGYVHFGCYEYGPYDPDDPGFEFQLFQCEGGAGNPILIVEEGANLALGSASFYGRGKIVNYGNIGIGDNGEYPVLYGQGVVENFGTFAPFWAVWDYYEPLFGKGTFYNRCGASTEYLVGDIDNLAARDEALKNFTWTDLWGFSQESPCAGDDTDEDGVDDLIDLFPGDPLESADRDNDGVGDNGDKFPDDPLEQSDLDEDGIGDNSDEFPYAVTQAASGGIQVTTTPLSADSDCSLMDVTAEPLAAQAPAKTAKLVDLQATFSLRGCGVDSGIDTTAESILITIDFGVELPEGVKVFKVPGLEDWKLIPNAIVEGSTVTYMLTDNGELDDNPVLGEIDDPVTVLAAIDMIFKSSFENGESN